MAQEERGLLDDADGARSRVMPPQAEGMTQEGDAPPPARPRRRPASGRGGCCPTYHTRLAQLVALLEAQTVRAMPGHIPLTPEAYLEGLYQAAADRARRAGRGEEPARTS